MLDWYIAEEIKHLHEALKNYIEAKSQWKNHEV